MLMLLSPTRERRHLLDAWQGEQQGPFGHDIIENNPCVCRE
jgi:hypothetical protein